MGLGAEAFTILAVLEARDQISEVMERVNSVMESFADVAGAAADAAGASGTAIDASLLQTASGTDALDLANARLLASSDAVKVATMAQGEAQLTLMDVQAKSAAGQMDAQEASAKLAVALKALSDADKTVAEATGVATAAQERQMAVMGALADAAREEAEAMDVSITSQEDVDAAAASSSKTLGMLSSGVGLLAVGLGAAAIASIKAAGDFQNSTTHLVTDAGESAKNLAMIQQGMLAIASATGTSADDLSNAMYHIESAGFHGAAGLQVLQTAAEGAKVGGADLDTVSKTLVGAMNSLGLSGSQATMMMNELVATTGAGDMKMQDLASSISSVLPLAAAAHITFAQVGGAIATMTSQGMQAAQASQDLANTIRALSDPSHEQITEMAQLGLNSNKVAEDLGKNGLTGTIQTFTAAIAAHMSGGEVFIQTLQNSKNAAADANIALTKLPTSIQAMAKGLMAGTVTAAQWTTKLGTMSAQNQELGTQFLGLVKDSGKFNDLISSGTPAAQTYNAALAKLMGNATAMNTALLVGGQRMSTYTANVKTIQSAADAGGTSVENWSTIQQTFNQKMDVLKSSVEAAGISIGLTLLPAATKIMDVFVRGASDVSQFIVHNKTLVALLASVAAGMMAGAIAMKLWAIAMKAWAAIQTVVNVLMGDFDVLADANPIGIIVVAIAALVAALIYCYVHFKTFHDIVEDTFNFMKTAVVDVLGFIEGHWREIIVILLGPMGLAIALITKYWSQLVEAAEATWHALVDTWHALETAGVDTWHALEAAWSAVCDAADDTWHALETAWDAITHVAKELWQQVTTVWNDILDVTTRVWDAVLNFLKKWWPLLLVVFAPFIALAISLWNHFHKAIFATAETIWDDISNFLKGVWNGISSTATSIWNTVSGFFKNTWDEISSVATTVWNDIHDFIYGIDMDIWHFIVSVWDSVFSYLKGRWGVIESYAETVWNDIYQYIIKPVENVWHFISSIWDTDVVPFLKSRWNNIKGNAEAVWNDIYSAIINPIMKAWSDLVHLMDEIVDAIKNGLNTAWDDVKNIGNDFVQIGKDIVDGIIKGVEDGAGDLGSSLKNLANSALSGAKHFLGIGSPSTLFRDQVGQWIPAGIGAGITGNTAAVKGALRTLSSQMPSMMSPHELGTNLAANFTGGTGSSVGTGGYGTQINLNFDFDGAHVMSDADMTKLANAVGRVITTKMLPGAGVRIHA